MLTIINIHSDHLTAHLAQTDLWSPSQFSFRFGTVAQQMSHLGGSEKSGIYRNSCFTVFFTNTDFVDAFAGPLDGFTNFLETPFRELFDVGKDVGGNHVVVWLVLLEDHPHGSDVVFGVAPISFGMEMRLKK